MSKINNFMLRKVASLQTRKMEAQEEGQGLAEYGLILALVAVACVVALGALAGGLQGVLGSVTGSLAV